MNQITINGKELLFVEVPGNYNVELHEGYELSIGPKGMHGDGDTTITLPDGNWDFMFYTKNVTEEQAAGILESGPCNDPGDPAYRTDLFKCYMVGHFNYFNATTSLKSLIRHLFGYSKEPKNYAVLQKIEA